MNIKIGILNVPKHCNKHDLIHFVTGGDYKWLLHYRYYLLNAFPDGLLKYEPIGETLKTSDLICPNIIPPSYGECPYPLPPPFLLLCPDLPRGRGGDYKWLLHYRYYLLNAFQIRTYRSDSENLRPHLSKHHTIFIWGVPLLPHPPHLSSCYALPYPGVGVVITNGCCITDIIC